MGIPFDPDFDAKPNTAAPSDFFGAFGARTSFLIGIATSVGIVATIGFLILLARIL